MIRCACQGLRSPRLFGVRYSPAAIGGCGVPMPGGRVGPTDCATASRFACSSPGSRTYSSFSSCGSRSCCSSAIWCITCSRQVSRGWRWATSHDEHSPGVRERRACTCHFANCHHFASPDHSQSHECSADTRSTRAVRQRRHFARPRPPHPRARRPATQTNPRFTGSSRLQAVPPADRP